MVEPNTVNILIDVRFILAAIKSLYLIEINNLLIVFALFRKKISIKIILYYDIEIIYYGKVIKKKIRVNQ